MFLFTVRRERETRTEVRKGCDLNISSHSKTEGITFL